MAINPGLALTTAGIINKSNRRRKNSGKKLESVAKIAVRCAAGIPAIASLCSRESVKEGPEGDTACRCLITRRVSARPLQCDTPLQARSNRPGLTLLHHFPPPSVSPDDRRAAESDRHMGLSAHGSSGRPVTKPSSGRQAGVGEDCGRSCQIFPIVYTVSAAGKSTSTSTGG